MRVRLFEERKIVSIYRPFGNTGKKIRNDILPFDKFERDVELGKIASAS
jgi:hypothetical protein